MCSPTKFFPFPAKALVAATWRKQMGSGWKFEPNALISHVISRKYKHHVLFLSFRYHYKIHTFVGERGKVLLSSALWLISRSSLHVEQLSTFLTSNPTSNSSNWLSLHNLLSKGKTCINEKASLKGDAFQDLKPAGGLPHRAGLLRGLGLSR